MATVGVKGLRTENSVSVSCKSCERVV